MFIPSMLLRQLYTVGSLENTERGAQFCVKNRLADAEVTALKSVRIDGAEVPLRRLQVHSGNGRFLGADEISAANPLPFPLKQSFYIRALDETLDPGKHELEITVEATPFGKLKIEVQDAIDEQPPRRHSIPRDGNDDYTFDAVHERQAFVEAHTGLHLRHLKHYSFDPHRTSGNCEHFTGVAQVPLGIAGPLHVNGEHAQGDFLIPMATTEGTLVASYNRGIQVLNLCGGVKCTVLGGAMQRAPVFVFDDARAGIEFVAWLEQHRAQIQAEAEATSSVAQLQYIDPYLASKFVYLRFGFATGDAAGQNMVSRATYAACGWILDHFPGIRRFYLESNLATDKKHSHINQLRTRGKRVTAEATIGRDVLLQRMRVEPEALAYHYQVANVGAMLAGANNNGLHSANAITAMFIATGQDVANLAESSAAVVYVELTPEKDLYLSVTLPSLIVATHGGGTGLPTQRECLEMMDCYGKGRVNRFAEIVAGVVLAGELSLAAAISALEWVSSHERYGRNR